MHISQIGSPESILIWPSKAAGLTCSINAGSGGGNLCTNTFFTDAIFSGSGFRLLCASLCLTCGSCTRLTNFLATGITLWMLFSPNVVSFEHQYFFACFGRLFMPSFSYIHKKQIHYHIQSLHEILEVLRIMLCKFLAGIMDSSQSTSCWSFFLNPKVLHAL